MWKLVNFFKRPFFLIAKMLLGENPALEALKMGVFPISKILFCLASILKFIRTRMSLNINDIDIDHRISIKTGSPQRQTNK